MRKTLIKSTHTHTHTHSLTPSVTGDSQHASAVSDVADVLVSVDYANDDVEWLNGSGGGDVLDTVLASALA